MVYHTTNGRLYHTVENCSGMRGAALYSLEGSVAAGFKACSKCSAPAASLLEEQYVVWTDAANAYHTTDECAAFFGSASLMALSDAAKAGYAPCAKCGAAAYAPAGAGTEELFAPTPVPTGTLSRDELLELAKGVAVYYSKTGSKSYHTADCEYKFDAKNAHTLYEAIQDGKGVCGICHPPTLDSLK